MKQDESKNVAKSKASTILVAGIVGGLLLGAILTAITGNPFPQMGIGLAVGIVIAACVMALRNKK
jgi:nicotinamide riboside transporter PnuC